MLYRVTISDALHRRLLAISPVQIAAIAAIDQHAAALIESALRAEPEFNSWEKFRGLDTQRSPHLYQFSTPHVLGRHPFHSMFPLVDKDMATEQEIRQELDMTWEPSKGQEKPRHDRKPANPQIIDDGSYKKIFGTDPPKRTD